MDRSQPTVAALRRRPQKAPRRRRHTSQQRV